jgi:2-phosphosulfolactate phosphatase
VTPTIKVVPAVATTTYADILADDPIAIVSDVIRATTTATTAIARGNRCLPVETIEDAFTEAAKHQDPILAGEQGGELLAGFDFGNSPVAVDGIENRTIILLSTSGTRVLMGARAAADVFVGCLRNAAATSAAVAVLERDVVFLAACTRGEFRDEDRLLAGWTVRDLVRSGYEPADALTRETAAVWGDAPASAILNSASVEFLRRGGHEADLEFILARIDDLPFAVKVSGDELQRAPTP